MEYAEVAVNSPLAQRRTFSYAVPTHMDLVPGQAVRVPFGSSVLQGIVLQLTDHPSVEETKEIMEVIDLHPLLSPAQIELAHWLSEYYLSPIFAAVALMLPPGFEQRLTTFIQLHPDRPAIPSLTTDQKYVLNLLQEKERVKIKHIEKALGKKRAGTIINQLQSKGVIFKSWELGGTKVRPLMLSHLRLTVETDVARREAALMLKRGAHKQAALLKFLIEESQPVPSSEVKKQVGCTAETMTALEKKGLIAVEETQVWRDPLAHYTPTPSTPPPLTETQEAVWRQVEYDLKQCKPQTYLLHGITGSGKTEIYMRALAQTIAQGKRGIVLVPEIALTPQTIERFAARFPHRVAVLHSKLSLGEQFDEWWRIKNGCCDVVIGSRGAIFAPQPDLGLIIIDEEHEWTYKQQEQAPRYHTREVAGAISRLNGAMLILGSATPDVESYHHSQTGKYKLLYLRHRIAPASKPRLPEIEVVDMRQELKAGNRSIFSRALSNAMTETLNAGGQIILFLNRRGTSTFVQCRNCGFVLRCSQCEVALTYHSAEEDLVCHQCNRHIPIPNVCPRCGSRRIKFLGLGTEGVMKKTAQAFPQARLLRWDRDAIRSKYSHEEIMAKFRAHEVDILIGTQMIAKGLDFPSVTLVGVISADTILSLPDLRASERTFQLLSQVTGRAGRGEYGGKAIIQTYTPKHYAIAAAAENNYDAFYRREIEYRRQLHAPPFSHLARLLYTNTNDTLCHRETKRMYHLLEDEKRRDGRSDIHLIGPAPAYIQRIRGRFRWQIIIRGTNPSCFLARIPLPQGWAIDIDPVTLL